MDRLDGTTHDEKVQALVAWLTEDWETEPEPPTLRLIQGGKS